MEEMFKAEGRPNVPFLVFCSTQVEDESEAVVIVSGFQFVDMARAGTIRDFVSRCVSTFAAHTCGGAVQGLAIVWKRSDTHTGCIDWVGVSPDLPVRATRWPRAAGLASRRIQAWLTHSRGAPQTHSTRKAFPDKRLAVFVESLETVFKEEQNAAKRAYLQRVRDGVCPQTPPSFFPMPMVWVSLFGSPPRTTSRRLVLPACPEPSHIQKGPNLGSRRISSLLVELLDSCVFALLRFYTCMTKLSKLVALNKGTSLTPCVCDQPQQGAGPMSAGSAGTTRAMAEEALVSLQVIQSRFFWSCVCLSGSPSFCCCGLASVAASRFLSCVCLKYFRVALLMCVCLLARNCAATVGLSQWLCR